MGVEDVDVDVVVDCVWDCEGDEGVGVEGWLVGDGWWWGCWWFCMKDDNLDYIIVLMMMWDLGGFLRKRMDGW